MSGFKLVALSLSLFLLAGVAAIVNVTPTTGAAPFESWLLHTATPLHSTGVNFEFVAADHNRDGAPDIIAVKKSDTGSGATEAHILSGASSYSQWSLHTPTLLHPTGANFTFTAGDFNGDSVPDLLAIKMSDTGSGRTEAHVLSGAAGFRQWLLNVALPLQPSDAVNWAFTSGDWDGDGRADLFVIKKQNTGTASTEIHVLSAASNYQQWIAHTGTALHQTGANFVFQTPDYNRDQRPDLMAIKMNGTGSGRTEVHILSGAGGFRQWLVQTAVALEPTDASNWSFAASDFDRNGTPDMDVIKKQNSGSGATEVHVLSGSATPPAGPATVIRKGNPALRTVHLSFDAGSDAGYTSQILDTLRSNGIIASFGITGRWAEQNPALLQRIVAEGHELINHTYDHSSFTGFSTGQPPLTTTQRWQQLDSTEQIVSQTTGASTRPYFRPPFGDYDNSVNVDVGARGYAYNVIWTVDSRGWQGLSAPEIITRCLNLAEPGAIYIFHVGSSSQDGPALQPIIDGLRARGYSFQTLSQMIAAL